MAKRDYYEVLGVARERDADDLKTAYPQARHAVPSRPQSTATRTAEAKFKEVNEAYEVLKDPQKRAAYDRFGHAAFENGGGGAAGRRLRLRLRRRLRRHLRRHVRRVHGRPARRQRRAAAASAAPTCATTWRSRSRRPSPARPREIARADHASPARPARAPAPSRGTQPAGLPDLRAATAGCARSRASSPIERTCPTCQRPRRRSSTNPCQACGGAGPRAREERTLSVNIPAGVEDGTRIRLAGEGEAGLRGGPAGDLYIFLSIKPHELLPARRRRHLLPRADLDDDGGARRRDRGADASTAARRAVKVPDGHPDRQAVPPAGQGHAGAALARSAATCTSRSRSRRRRT